MNGSPPNLRTHDDPQGGPIEACGRCTHYDFLEPYDPARSRDVGGRKKGCTKYAAEVSALDVCDDFRRAR